MEAMCSSDTSIDFQKKKIHGVISHKTELLRMNIIKFVKKCCWGEVGQY
jgi:hypothetical protein